MTLSTLLALLLLGFLTGGVSGVLGLGGGIIVIPALVFLFHFDYKAAVGTSLAMLLPPIGIFAFLTYYRHGHVDWRAAVALAGAFAVGALASAWVVNHYQVPDAVLKRIFALLLLYIAGHLLFHADDRAAAAWKTWWVLAGGALAYAAAHLAGRRWERRLNALTLYRANRQRVIKGDYQI